MSKEWWNWKWRAPLSYALAVVSPVLVLNMCQATRVTYGEQTSLVFFLVPILLSAYWGGLGFSLVATFESATLSAYYLIEPLHNFSIASATSSIALMGVVAAGVLTSILMEWLHRERRPIAGAGVDDRRPAYTLPEGDRERRPAERDRGAAVPVETLHPLEGRPDEVLLREVGALLEDDDAEAGTRELAGDHRTARARSDHAGVGDLLERSAHRRELERPEPRPGARRTVVEAVVLVAERGLDSRVSAERREADHAEQREGHPSPRCAACRALLHPGGPRGWREAAERSEMPRGERACLPGAEEHAQLAARRRGQAREVGPDATDHVHLRGADGEGPTLREEGLGQRGDRARLGAGEHARAP